MKEKINVLYIQHVGVQGGSFKSIYLVAKELSDKKKINPYFISVHGVNNIKIKESGFLYKSVSGLSQFDNGRISLYKGVRWLILVREILLLPSTVYAIMYAAFKWKNIDVIHVNEITLIGVVVLAKIFIKKPIVLHVRSMQSIRNNIRRRVIMSLVNKYVDIVIPIDGNVASTLNVEKKIKVIHNSEVEPDVVICDYKNENKIIRFGIVANYLRYKGVEDYVQAAMICLKENKTSDLQFLIYGDSQAKNKDIIYYIRKIFGFDYDVKRKILSIISKNEYENVIKVCGFVSDPKVIYTGIDVLVFPSWLDAVGRPVFEAAHYGLPSIVALKEKRSDDAIQDGVTGFVVKERSPIELAAAMQKFIDNPTIIKSMGIAANRLALEQFNLKKNTMTIYDMYCRLIDWRKEAY